MSVKKNQRFYVLDTFRGFAAILVFFYHMPNKTLLTDNLFINNAGFFVDLFFILSGFVIFHNYKNEKFDIINSKLFIVKRLKRIIPLHVYTLLVLLLLEVFKYQLNNYLPFANLPFQYHTLKAFFTQLFLLNSTPLFTGFQWNGVNWSVSAEFFSYILFTILSFAILINKKKFVFFSVITVILGYTFFFFKYGSFDLTADFKYSFIRGIIGFFIGVIIYKIRPYAFILMNEKSLFKKNLVEMLSISFIIITVSFFNTKHFYILHLAFGFLILVFSMEFGITSFFLKKNIFQKIGLWSYSIYLNHYLIIYLYQMLFVKLFNLEGNKVILLELLALLIICIYSANTYKYIETRFYSNLK